jgi:ADP-glucose pyrophosphorylase
VIDRTAAVADSVIWDDVSVGARAKLNRCIVADGVKIASGASFSSCAIIQRDGELMVADI